LQLGYSYLSTLPLRDVARPHLEELSADLHETAGLAILDGEEIVYVAIAMSPRLTSVRINLGSRFPARETAAGRVLLAYRDSSDPELSRIRADGYCVLDGELGEDLRGVAAPVPEAQGVSAAVGVSLHSGRHEVPELIARFAPTVTAVAERIAGSAR
jgi:IclR family transcriptional regulator, pca regulon regulatory protein